MSLAALGLLFAAAVLHAGWNLLVKRAKQKQVFTWWAILVGAVCFSPALIVNRPLPLRIWPYVAGSALFEALYFVGLTRAYDLDDFSLVYPLARGTAPALLVVWAALFLGEQPHPTGLAGLTLLVLGLIIVGSAAWWSQRQIATPSLLCVAIALATACCISIYSAIDGAAVHLVPSAPYTVVILGLSMLLIAPALLLHYCPGSLYRLALAGRRLRPHSFDRRWFDIRRHTSYCYCGIKILTNDKTVDNISKESVTP